MSWMITHGAITDHVIDVVDEVGNEAKFKQPRDQGPRKLIEITNELVVHQLARMVGLPTAYTSLARIENRPGIVSALESELTWKFIVENHLQGSVINLDSFRQLGAFDIWINNTDRSSGRADHVIVKQLGDRYFMYPIDASHTLNGCSGELWTVETVANTLQFQPEAYSHLGEVEIRGYSHLEPAVIKIQTLSDSAISSIVDSVTLQVGTGRPLEETDPLKKNGEVVKRLLFLRRDSVAEWARRWCRSKGKETEAESFVAVRVG